MRIEVRTGDPVRSRVDLLIVIVAEGDALPEAIGAGAFRRRVEMRLRGARFRGRRAEIVSGEGESSSGPRFWAVIGAGRREGAASLDVRRGGTEGAMEAFRRASRRVALVVPEGLGEAVRAAAEGFLQGAYRFDRYRSDRAAKAGAVRELAIHVPSDAAAARASVRRAETLGKAVTLARDLVNEPPSRLAPPAFAVRAAAAAREAGLRATVHDAAGLRRLGMESFLAVGRGSAAPPRLVHLVYRPRRGRPSRRIALVGKGVTFDSGGLDLKPASGMRNMKADMAGAAAVLAAMTALPAAGCRAEVHGFLGLVENMTGANAFKPGDILRTLSGKTVEVANTDAEGRLVLCDVITHAAGRVKPDALVDVATLTGAVVVALGPLAAGLFSNDGILASALETAAADAGEKVWRMPLYDEYLDDLKSGPADLQNVGDRWGGAITAALFLREFVPDGLPWAHLDIAGPAFLEKAAMGLPVGATGAGVATLLRWLEGA